MEIGNPNDPLLLQVLPQPEELLETAGFNRDPLDEAASFHSGTITKYPRRTLILASNACGIHCRFCFRRYLRQMEPETDTVLPNDPAIEEIILSGGDPLMLDDNELGNLCQRIVRLPNIKRLRIHSRLPVAEPSRMSDNLNTVLNLPIPVYLVLHINHTNELNDEFREYRRWLRSPILLSQTVLLQRINDNLETLDRLFTRLTDMGIVPYYLHQLDKIHGAAHFEVPLATGCQLVQQLRRRLSGYAVPQYVREIADSPCKEICYN
ncbi:EF-P beta-lysylation protein EpmB [Planctomycetales bacterium]|nr:EF-P beta-lysylation protein EpmB [Planctomycetales bacterium]